MYHLRILRIHTLIMILFSLRTESQVMLSPSGDIAVCPGSQLSFRCSTNLTFLEWNVTVSLSGKPESRQKLVTPSSPLHLQLTISGQLLNITRNITSNHNSSLLVSMLTITKPVADLSATLIACTEIGSSRAESSTSMATINVINPSLTPPGPPYVETPVVLEFGTENVAIVINWIQSEHYGRNNIAYTVDAMPQVMVILINTTSAHLQVSYNTQYTVSITATLCGLINATNIVALNFVKCVHPQKLPMIDDSLRALIENVPALAGTNATFSCLPGLIFRGPHRSTCIENGEWEPDPRNVECIANCGPPSTPPTGYIFPYTSTLNGAVVNFTCQKPSLNLEKNFITAVCSRQGIWNPDPAEFCISASGTNQDILIIVTATLSTTVVVALLLCIIITIYCGCVHQQNKLKNRKKPRPRKPTPPPKELYYKIIRPLCSEENSIELTEQMQTKPKAIMYDDVIPHSTQVSDLLENPKRCVAMYDDILPPSEQDLEQNVKKPKVMYDELLPPSEQAPVELKKNMAYHPADLK